VSSRFSTTVARSRRDQNVSPRTQQGTGKSADQTTDNRLTAWRAGVRVVSLLFGDYALRADEKGREHTPNPFARYIPALRTCHCYLPLVHTAAAAPVPVGLTAITAMCLGARARAQNTRRTRDP